MSKSKLDFELRLTGVHSNYDEWRYVYQERLFYLNYQAKQLKFFIRVLRSFGPSFPLSFFSFSCLCLFFFPLSLFRRFFPFLFHPFALSLDLFLIISLFHPFPPVLFSFPYSFLFLLFLFPSLFSDVHFLPLFPLLPFFPFGTFILNLNIIMKERWWMSVYSTLIMSLLPDGRVSTVSISSTATRISRSKAGANHPRYTNPHEVENLFRHWVRWVSSKKWKRWLDRMQIFRIRLEYDSTLHYHHGRTHEYYLGYWVIQRPRRSDHQRVRWSKKLILL